MRTEHQGVESIFSKSLELLPVRGDHVAAVVMHVNKLFVFGAAAVVWPTDPRLLERFLDRGPRPWRAAAAEASARRDPCARSFRGTGGGLRYDVARATSTPMAVQDRPSGCTHRQTLDQPVGSSPQRDPLRDN
jgi:hypothetical protein